MKKDLNSDEIASMKLQEMESIFTKFWVERLGRFGNSYDSENTMKQWILSDFSKRLRLPFARNLSSSKTCAGEEKEQLLSYFSQC